MSILSLYCNTVYVLTIIATIHATKPLSYICMPQSWYEEKTCTISRAALSLVVRPFNLSL